LHKPIQLAGFLDPYTSAYPEKVKVKVVIELKDGQKFTTEKDDYHGFHTRPLSWTDIEKKFKRLSKGIIDNETQERIINITANLENKKTDELINLLTGFSKAKKLTKHLA
jgi:2-methylcitrate dehydratase